MLQGCFVCWSSAPLVVTLVSLQRTALQPPRYLSVVILAEIRQQWGRGSPATSDLLDWPFNTFLTHVAKAEAFSQASFPDEPVEENNNKSTGITEQQDIWVGKEMQLLFHCFCKSIDLMNMWKKFNQMTCLYSSKEVESCTYHWSGTGSGTSGRQARTLPAPSSPNTCPQRCCQLCRPLSVEHGHDLEPYHVIRLIG